MDTLYLVFKHQLPNCIWIALQTIKLRPKQTGTLTQEPYSVKRTTKLYSTFFFEGRITSESAQFFTLPTMKNTR
jgi:hypothetical protein